MNDYEKDFESKKFILEFKKLIIERFIYLNEKGNDKDEPDLSVISENVLTLISAFSEIGKQAGKVLGKEYKEMFLEKVINELTETINILNENRDILDD